MKQLFKTAKWHHWASAGNWLAYTVLLGALPFWGLAMIRWLAASSMPLSAIVNEGQLAVYAAGLLAASVPALQKEVKDSPFKHPKWFLSVSLTVILTAALVFGSAAMATTPLNVARIAGLSAVLTVIALVLGFLTELVSEVKHDPNLWNIAESQVEALGDRVRDKLQGPQDA